MLNIDPEKHYRAALNNIDGYENVTSKFLARTPSRSVRQMLAIFSWS